MQPIEDSRDIRARAIAIVLWALLWIAVITVIAMTWHPWVIGERRFCPAGQHAGWDGRCRSAETRVDRHSLN